LEFAKILSSINPFAVNISHRQRLPADAQVISSTDIFAAAVVVAASVVYFNTYVGDVEHLRLFDERNQIII
jgi:hypothetical protein